MHQVNYATLRIWVRDTHAGGRRVLPDWRIWSSIRIGTHNKMGFAYVVLTAKKIIAYADTAKKVVIHIKFGSPGIACGVKIAGPIIIYVRTAAYSSWTGS